MSQIAEELSFAVLSITKLKTSRCSCYFLEVSLNSKVALLQCYLATCQNITFLFWNILILLLKKMVIFWHFWDTPCGQTTL